MKKLKEYEINALKAYLALPARKLLNHEFEMEEDFLVGHVQGFLKGERFDKDFIAFSKEEIDIITPLISKCIETDDGKDLLTAVLLTKTVCNIMNKYKKT